MVWLVKEGGTIPEYEYVAQQYDTFIENVRHTEYKNFVISIFIVISLILILCLIYILFIKIDLTGKWYSNDATNFIIVKHNKWSDTVQCSIDNNILTGTYQKGVFLLRDKNGSIIKIIYCAYDDSIFYKNKIYNRPKFYFNK